jgi:ribosomal peptide maturation radical SAM protein 1
LYNRPSIQLGTLKGYLKVQSPELNIRALHLYLKIAERIGYPIYQVISERTWLAESVFSGLLFPERRKEIEKLFYRESRGISELQSVDFETLISHVKNVSDGFIDGLNWESFGLVGFSICLCQLTSSLYFIRRIKQCCPNLPIVVGGSMFSGYDTYGLLKTFQEIDFVVNGEAELPLSRLVRFMTDSQRDDNLPNIPGVVTRQGVKSGSALVFDQLPSLESLPPPDYDDYFDLLKTLGSEKRFFPILPAEVSRGCWWRSTDCSSSHRGCTFCNLNLQWYGYRSKSASHVVSEVDFLTSKYKTLSVAFMDNSLPLKQSQEIFSELGTLEKDLLLFAEIRATTSREILKAMRAAGTEEVQIGIEAISTKLLKKLNKGTTAIQNLEIMKHCEELGISNISNLILQFPSSDDEDVDETLHALNFVLPFRPLKLVHFWLGVGSQVWQEPLAYGLKAVFNHPTYRILFPHDIYGSMRFTIQSYRGDLVYQRKLWRSVKKKVKEWNRAYDELHRGRSYSPILSLRDGRDFIVIRQKRFGREPLVHQLVGTSRTIYLFCQKNQKMGDTSAWQSRFTHEFPIQTSTKSLLIHRLYQ